MSPIPILLAFTAAMGLFGVWVYFGVRESLQRDLAHRRVPIPVSPLPQLRQPVPVPLNRAPLPVPMRSPARPPSVHPPMRRRVVAHAAGLAIGVLLVTGLAVNGSQARHAAPHSH